jgi:hypothetical protein
MYVRKVRLVHLPYSTIAVMSAPLGLRAMTLPDLSEWEPVFFNVNPLCLRPSFAMAQDLIHILTSLLIDACMNGEELRAKAQESMTQWKLQRKLCTTMEKGFHGHTHNPKGQAIPPLYDNMQNRCNLVFWEHDDIGMGQALQSMYWWAVDRVREAAHT